MLVHEWMRTEVITLNPEPRVERVWELMEHQRVRHLPVVDEAGKLVGILTETDLLKALVFLLRKLSSL
jgi:acetoin utilization protein AcuB